MTVAQPVVVLGASGHAREILDVLEALNAEGARYVILGFVAPDGGDHSALHARGYEVLGSDEILGDIDAAYVIGIGSPDARRRLDRVAGGHGLVPVTLVHPAATVAARMQMAPGVVIAAGAQVSSGARLGRHTHVGLNATVGHDCVLGDYVTVNAQAALSGDVTVESGATIGTNSAVIQGRRVARDSLVGAGAVIVHDVPAAVTAFGVPARPLGAPTSAHSDPRSQQRSMDGAVGRLRGHNVLLVGGAGYVGAVLAGELLAAGARVRILDELLYDNGFALAHLLEDPACAFVKGDVTDLDVRKAALDGVSDVVLLAALVGDPICRRYPQLAARVNQLGGIHLYEAVRDSDAQRFVFTSTCSNYGIQQADQPAAETAALNPQSLYSDTKVAVERFVLAQHAEVRAASTVLRLATAYGLSPRMRLDLTVSHFTRALADGERLVVYDADTWRPYCHVRDIAKAVMTVLTQPAERVDGQVFNVGSDDQQFTKRMLVHEVADHLDQVDVEYRTGDTDPRDYRVSFAKIAATIGFAADYTVQRYIPTLLSALEQGVLRRADSEPDVFGNYDVVGGDGAGGPS